MEHKQTKINIRRLTESQYKKQKNIPSQELPRRCQPDMDLPINLLMIPKPMVSIPGHSQRQNPNLVGSAQHSLNSNRTARTLSYTSQQSLIHPQVLSKQLPTTQSQSNLPPMVSMLSHQRNTSHNSLQEISQRGLTTNSSHPQLMQAPNPAEDQVRELRTQLQQEKDNYRVICETLQKMELSQEQRVFEARQLWEGERLEMQSQYERMLNEYKSALNVSEQEMMRVRQQESSNSISQERYEEKIAMLTQELMRIRQQESSHSISQEKFEEKIAMLTQEIERLRYAMQEKTSNLSKQEEKIVLLTSEIERLRFAQKEVQDNLQMSTSEVEHLRFSLQERSTIYQRSEEKIVQLTSEITRLSSMVERSRQIEESTTSAWERRVEAITAEKARQLEQISAREEERVAQMAQEIERLNTAHGLQCNSSEERIVNLTVEIERLTHLLNSRQHSSDDAVSSLTAEIDSLHSQLEQTNSQSQERIVNMAMEINRLQEMRQVISDERDKMLAEMKSAYEERISVMQTDIVGLQDQLRVQEQEISEKEESVKRSKQRSHEERESLRADTDAKQHEILTLTNQLTFVSMEVNRLQERLEDASLDKDKAQTNEMNMTRELELQGQMLNQKSHEITNLIEKIQSLEREIDLQRQQFEAQKHASVNREIQELNIKFNSERKYFETQLLAARETNKELENNLSIIIAETDRLRSLCDRKASEIEELKQNELTLMHKMESLTIQLRSSIASIADKEREGHLLLEELRKELEREHRVEIESIEREAKREFNSLQNSLHEAQERNMEALMTLVLVTADAERLKEQQQKLWEDNCVLLEKTKEIELEAEREVNNFKISVEETNRLYLQQEIDTMNSKLEYQQNQFTTEINNYLIQINQATDSNQSMQKHIEELQNRVVLVSTENSRLQALITERDSIIKSMENGIIELQNELEKRGEINQLLSNQITEQEGTITSLNSNLFNVLQNVVLSKSALESQSEKVEQLEKQTIPQLEAMLAQQRSEFVMQLDTATRTAKDSELFAQDKLQSVLLEVVLARSELERTSQESNELKQSLSKCDSQIYQLQQELTMLSQSYSELENNRSGLVDQYNALGEQYGNLEKEFLNLQETMNEKEDQVKRSKKASNDELEQAVNEKNQLAAEKDELIVCLQELEGNQRALNEEINATEAKLQEQMSLNFAQGQEYYRTLNAKEELISQKEEEIQSIQIKIESISMQFMEEKNYFLREIEGYEGVIAMLEQNIEVLQSEKNQLLAQAQERMKQLEDWRYGVSGDAKDSERLLKETEQQRQKIHEMEDKLIQKNEAYMTLQMQLGKIEQSIKYLEDEKQDLLSMLESRKQENDMKSQEVLDMREKINSLSEKIKQLEVDLIKKEDASQSHEVLKQSQINSRGNSEVKSKYAHMFRTPLEQKDNSNIHTSSVIQSSSLNKNFDLAQFSKVTTVYTTTTTSIQNKENKQYSSEVNDSHVN